MVLSFERIIKFKRRRDKIANKKNPKMKNPIHESKSISLNEKSSYSRK
jgi:hypothetical protein